MERWSGKTAIVTGAGAGFGNAISELLVKNGVKVVVLFFLFLSLQPE